MRRALWVTACVLTVAFAGCSPARSTSSDGGLNPDAGALAPGAFDIALGQTSLTVGQGAVISIPITVVRGASFSGDVTLTATGLPDGLQLSFDGDDTAQLIVPFGTTPGTSTLEFIGTSGTVSHSVQLAVTVSAASSVLLVDNDGSDNNTDVTQGPSATDALFTTTLDALQVSYDVLRVPGTGDSQLTPDIAAGYAKIIWYTGDADDVQALNEDQVDTLSGYLTTLDGDRELLLFSENGVQAELSDASIADPWNDVSGDTFLADVLGLAGAAGDIYDDVTGDVTVAGSASTATQGLSLAVGYNAVVYQSFDALKPASGTDVLLTLSVPVTVDVDTTVNARSFAVGLGHTFTASGHTGTKKAVTVSFPVENVVDAGGNTRKAAIAALLQY